MAHISEEDGLFVVYDNDGGFTEFSNQEDANDFLLYIEE